jgi:hypothetical protein
LILKIIVERRILQQKNMKHSPVGNSLLNVGAFLGQRTFSFVESYAAFGKTSFSKLFSASISLIEKEIPNMTYISSSPFCFSGILSWTAESTPTRA